MKKTLALLATCVAFPASAQTVETFELPQGCTAHLTVQTEDCSVDHMFTCEGDNPSHQRRVSIGQDGVSYIGEIDGETQWIESVHIFSGRIERLSDDVTDPASISELIESGVDTYDFTTESDEIGQTRYVGFDSLTGKQVTIDGVTLDETEYQITAYDAEGEVKWASEGNEYISQRFRMFLAGTSSITNENGTFEIEGNPVEFIFEGEAGFLSANPKYGCGVTESSAPSILDRLEALNNEL